MSICSNCYKSQIRVKHDVGHWWNNPPDSVFVCSDKCYTELEKLVKDRTWMDYKPEAIFGKKKKAEKKKTIEAITDKQFSKSMI
tara:strand:- start:135 stop:386 length:252 start_codon:yes stop_codon:yes gene_type:complete